MSAEPPARRFGRRRDRQLGRHARTGLVAALFAAGAARPSDRLLAVAAAVLVVVGAGRGRRSCPRRRASSHIALFFIGAFAMRGAGCTWNDIVDRDLDGSVERTRSRPIPSGQVSVAQAALFLVLQALVGFAVLISFNAFTIALGIASLAIVAVYPFMKRITYWPQIVLGLAFSWGALMGWAAAFGRLDWPALLLYAGSISWVIGYDTIYAHQDRDDDALIGIKSTALLFGARTKPMLALFYGLAVILIGAAGLARRRRHWSSRSASSPSPRISAGRSPASTSPIPIIAWLCSNPTAMPA